MSRIDWNGGAVRFHASGRVVLHGALVVKVCRTKAGARFAAWRRRREAGQS